MVLQKGMAFAAIRDEPTPISRPKTHFSIKNESIHTQIWKKIKKF
jgi:hypothetical protein